jgi:peptidoglycan hydrolase-like protein with peptidoglycan-binding domain
MPANISVFRLLLCCLAAAAMLLPGPVSADETTRRVQEELRKRRLYNGDLDGQQSPELGVALKRYQARKGFPESGVADAQTLRSMGIAEAADVPILLSDVAAQSPPPSTEMPQPTPMSIAGDITVPAPSREELRDFMRRYLDAAETENVTDELALYAPRVDYLQHGIVPKTYIRDRLAEYNQLWPQRKYTMDDEITISKRGDNTAATARVAYQLANPAQNRQADGAVNHTIVLARLPDSTFEIVGVQEQRARGTRSAGEGARSRSTKKRSSKARSTQRMTPLDRTLNKLFNPPKRKKRR